MGRAMKQRNFLAQPGRNCLLWIDIREVLTSFHCLLLILNVLEGLLGTFLYPSLGTGYSMDCTAWDDDNGTQILSQPYPGSAEGSLVNASACNTAPSAQGIQHLLEQ